MTHCAELPSNVLDNLLGTGRRRTPVRAPDPTSGLGILLPSEESRSAGDDDSLPCQCSAAYEK